MKQTIDQKKTNEPSDEEEKRIMEHMPYLNLLIEDIREVNRALREGQSAIPETLILLSDIPSKWCDSVQPTIDAMNKQCNQKRAMYDKYLVKGIPQTTKDWAEGQQVLAGREWALSIKPIVLSVLDSKDVLMMTKKIPDGKMFRIDEESDEND